MYVCASSHNPLNLFTQCTIYLNDTVHQSVCTHHMKPKSKTEISFKEETMVCAHTTQRHSLYMFIWYKVYPLVCHCSLIHG